MSRAGICLIKHMGKSSPIEAYRADMADDVAERVAGGEEVDAAWLAVIDDKLADLGTEAARIEQVVADAYAARPSKTAEQVDATHKDPGQPAEPVTQEVVAQAISKAAKSEERPRAAMRDELLAMIDAKMVDAKDEYLPTWKAPTREQIRQAMVGTGITNEARIVQMLEGQHQNRVAEASDRIGFVTFDVPGDGKFKVLNTRSKLEDFRKRVEQSPGFKDQRYREPGMTDASSGGKLAAFTGMVDEGDMQAALDYAAATGLDPKTAKLSDMLRKRLDKWMRDQEMAAAVAAREEPTAAPAAEAATVKESLTTETAAEPEEGAPAAANRLTEAQARKAFEWRDLGTKEGTRTYALFFADPADGRSMRYGEVTLFKGSTRFAVDGGEGAATLKAAKAEAEQLALVRLAQDGYAETPADPAPNDRDSFTLERVTANNTLEKVTFKRGEYITFRIGEGGKQSFGEIDGISHAKRQFSVDGLWYDFGFAYKAERPAETPKRGTVPMSKVVDAINKKHGAGLGPADAVSPIEAFKATMNAVYDGTASVEDYKAAYKRVRDAAAVKAELGKLTKDELIRTFGIMARPDEKKDSLVATAYKTMLRGFALGKEYGPRSYMMTRGGLENYEKQQAEALDAIVENHTADDLAAYAAEVKASREERAEPAKINDAGEKTRTDDTGNVALFSVFTPTFTVDANPDAAQTPADGQVSPDDRRAVELLQAGLRKQRPELVLNAVSSGSGAPGSQLSGRDDRARQAAADVAARLFGKRLTFFTSNVPLAAGAYSTKQPDRIFLARDNAHPIMAVTGHEILHAMRKDRPDLYDALLAAIRKNSADVDQAGLLLRLKYKKLNLTTPTPEVQEEEFLADVVGDRWTEPEFWALMSQGQPQGMRRVLAAIVSWLDALVDKIRNTRPFNTAVYLTDIKAARKAVAEAMRNYSAGEVGTVPDDGEVRFSLADPTDTPPMFSRAQQEKQERTAEKAAAAESPTPRDIAKSATQRIGELLNDPGTLTRWDNSLGTPYNLAQRFPAFKRVFEAMQDHAADISDFANSAADKAKTILPRLDRARDVFKGPLAAADAKAVQRPIFDGTLLWTRDAKNKPVLVADVEAEAADMSVFDKSERLLRERHIDPRVLKMWQGMPLETFTQIIEGKYKAQYLRPGIVWKPSELKAMFGLNDKQVGIYREFRAATNASLDRLAITTMIRAAMDPSLRSRVEGMSPSEAAEVIRPLAEEAARRDALAAGKTESAADKAAEAAGNKITETADRVEQLQAEGYAPLMRFGTRYVDVIVDGQRAYFGMYEGAIERSRDVARLRAMFPGAELRLGTVSTEDYKLFEGVSPETLALFADVVGLTDEQDKNAMFQEYLRNAVNNRSAMKRLIQRKAIQGFTEDVPRVLAGFITSNARASANNLNTKGIVEAIDAIDPRDARTGQGELKDYAVQLREFMQQPGEQAAALRGMMFHWYLGGNISSALVNMTQAFQTTLPELSKLVGASKATKLVTQAMGTIWKKRDGALGDALKRAENEGHVSPQELYHLDAMARGAGHLRSGESTTDKALAIGSNSITRLAFLWGRPFALAEQFNRRVTFIAAFQAAESKGLADPYAYAVDLIDASQFVYGMHNRPVWGRSFAGATLLTFKTFTISMLEAMYRNAKTPQGRKALVLMLLALFVLAGLEGLPFREDVEDVIDAIMQRLMDRNFHSREARDKAIKRLFNALMTDEYAEVASRFVQKGLSGVPGAPIDVAGRFSMANIIPGTGALTVKQDRFGDATELLGPVGGLVKQAGDAGGLLSEGRIVEGIKAALPTAGRNIAQGIQMATTGEYRDGRGNMVVKTDNVDAGFKAAGFQPNAVAAPRSAERLQQRRGDVARIKEAEMVNAFARAVRDDDSDAMTAAAAQYAAWNVNNPESRITITPAQVKARVKAMQSTSEERIIKRTPKEMRSSVVEGLAGAR